MAAAIGFNERIREEVAIVTGELATNLVKHAKEGWLVITFLENGGNKGIQIEVKDSGPGIENVERAISDSYSTTGTLGNGLGAVNRLMDDFDITSHKERTGTHIVCKRWLRLEKVSPIPCPLSFGAATRKCSIDEENGDTFIIKRWNENALVGIIDGVGHGNHAHHAAETARNYVESHFDQPLEKIFHGTHRACGSTRGVVMALARFDWMERKLSFASIGNIETRAFETPESMNFIVRRGVLGHNVPSARVTQHRWEPSYWMVLHSDGMKANWLLDDYRGVSGDSATVIAQRLLRNLARDDDDATVLVVKKA